MKKCQRIWTSIVERLLKVNKNTASGAFHGLIEHGFLVMTKGHLWQERLAREWRLTIEECNGRQATDDWTRWSQDNPVGVVPKNFRSQIREQNDPKVGTNRYQSKTQRLYSKEFEDLVTIE